MAQRRHHYEQAFEEYLRARRIPYVAVDEAKKALLPPGVRLGSPGAEGVPQGSLKSFDFVIYGQASNLLLEVKGRRVGRSRRGLDSPGSHGLIPRARRAARLESWVTLDDVNSLKAWEGLFGQGFEAAFAFVYWCDEQPPDALFQEVFEHRGRWYAIRTVRLADYAQSMRTRSVRWGTVHLPPQTYERVSHPLAGPDPFPLARDAAGRRRVGEPSLDHGPELPALERLV